MKKRRLVLIEWIDSHSGNGSRSLDDIESSAQPLHCRSVGWLIASKNGMKMLAASVSREKNTGIKLFGTCDIAIPNSALQKLTVLKDG